MLNRVGQKSTRQRDRDRRLVLNSGNDEYYFCVIQIVDPATRPNLGILAQVGKLLA